MVGQLPEPALYLWSEEERKIRAGGVVVAQGPCVGRMGVDVGKCIRFMIGS